MISFEDAQEIILKSAGVQATERVNLTDSLGRVLAEEVYSDLDNPPFNKSAMDGYACRREDIYGGDSKGLHINGIIPAGAQPDCQVTADCCVKIMTGAMMPSGADMVVPVEFTSLDNQGRVQVDLSATISDNIMKKGENVRQGDALLQPGILIKPQHIAIMATVGQIEPLVIRQPRVGVIATGDELVEPGETPGVSQIRDSNSSQLCAQITLGGGLPIYYGIARDNAENTEQIIRKAMADNDMILLSGGVSMGDFDLVPGILKKCGFQFLVEKVAVKPGKPTKFAVAPNCYCFGLPGNPVSTFIIFELFVRPFLKVLLGLNEQALEVNLPLAKTVKRGKTDRLAWVPARIKNNQVEPLRYLGSGHTNSLAEANGLISFPVGINILEEGTTVSVRQI